MIKAFVLAVLFAAAAALPARAETPAERSDWWLKECRYSGWDCLGFVLGMTEGMERTFDAMRLAGIDGKKIDAVARDLGLCAPAKVTVDGHRRIWIHWLEAHPDRLADRPAVTFIAAEKAEFCQ